MKEKTRNMLGKRVTVFGRSISVLLIGLIALTGVATAAVLTTYGTLTGSATVEQAITLDGNVCSDTDGTNCTETTTFDGTVSAGTTEIETHTLTNNADVAATVAFETSCDKDGSPDAFSPNTSRDINWNDTCDGITTKIVEYFDNAGHDFNGYSSPSDTDADVVVDDDGGEDFTSIQSAIDDSGTSSGDTILVKEGSYSGTVEVTKSDLTLVAENKPTSTDAATVSGAKTGFSITADGVTIKGFDVTADGGSDGLANARGIDVLANDATVESNYVHAVTDEERPIGIHMWAKNNDVNNAQITNNHIENVQATQLQGLASGRSESKAKGIALSGGDNTNTETKNANISYNTVENIGGNGEAAMSSGINIYGGTPVDFTVKYNQLQNIDHNEDTTAFGGTYRHPYAQGVYLSGLTKNCGSWCGVGNSKISNNNFEMTADAVVDAQYADYSNNQDYSFSESNNYWGTDGIEVADESQDISNQYAWQIKTDLTVEAGTTDTFGVVNDFAINLVEDDYDIATDILPQ